MSRVSYRSPATRGAPEELRRFGGGWVGAFGQMLIVGLFVTAMLLPVVTLPAAMAAGVRNLHRHVTHRPDSLTSMIADAARALRTGWWVGLAWAVVTGALVVNIKVVLEAPVPMGEVVAVLSGVLAVAVTVLVLRAAELWCPGANWRALVQAAAQDCVTRPGSTLMVVSGLAVAAVLIWMLPALIVITPGMVALALVASAHTTPQH